ncbi:hypothetical protein ES695_05910 [Candidatus Atribacteria bacterium 1244-E10-H5-B2]|nr:MAG: hypothetical protein ES695_05910 [Candidatus Atribacteria bacterium 1244-E10-H5-B2]
MKIKTDEKCELVVPKIIEDAWNKVKTETETDYEKYDYESSESEDFCRWWREEGINNFAINKKTLIKKEIAIFCLLMDDEDPCYPDTESGYCYNFSDWHSFIDNGYKYIFCTYGDKYRPAGFIGYKEALQK